MKITKGVINIDLDNVTADYMGGFRDFLISHKLAEPSRLVDPQHYSFVDSGWFDSFEEYKHLHDYFVSRGGFLSLPVMDGASDALHSIWDDFGVKIRIVTNRFLNKGRYAQVVSDTARWLDVNRIPFHDFCVVSDKTFVGGDLLLDDSPENIASLRAKRMPVVVFGQDYNKKFSKPRVNSWGEFYQLVKESV